jgi:hypothetical protein
LAAEALALVELRPMVALLAVRRVVALAGLRAVALRAALARGLGEVVVAMWVSISCSASPGARCGARVVLFVFYPPE